MATPSFLLLVSTYVVCERLSVMQRQAGVVKNLDKKSESAPPPQMIWADLGTLSLIWSGELTTPTPYSPPTPSSPPTPNPQK